jgi:AcrR family transcriptional regulator
MNEHVFILSMNHCSNLSRAAYRLGSVPRGIAIPQLRQQLFAAAEVVILRDGPAKLSGRAVTSEAGVAAGLLYAHFTDLDDFLTGYAVDRGFTVAAAAAAMPERAGEGDMSENLCDALLAIPRPTLTALARLLVLHPDLAPRVHAVLGDRTAGLEAIERAASEYLAAERRIGRLPEAADPSALALALVSVLHHLVLTADTADDVPARLRRAVASLLGSTSAAPSELDPLGGAPHRSELPAGSSVAPQGSRRVGNSSAAPRESRERGSSSAAAPGSQLDSPSAAPRESLQ